MHDPFDYYPASSAVIRGAAEGTRANGISVRDLMDEVEQDHQAAVWAVDRAPVVPWAFPMLPTQAEIGSAEERVERVSGGVDILIGAITGLSNAEQAKANQSYASQVVFQENVNGDRRAIINLYQVQSDGDQLLIRQAFGLIDDHGDIFAAAVN